MTHPPMPAQPTPYCSTGSHQVVLERLYVCIEALDIIEPTGPFERAVAGLLLAAYKRRLRSIVGAAPAWVSEKILSASENISDQRPVLWLSDN